MKNTTKLAALFMAAAMMLALASCGGTKKPETDINPGAGETDAAETPGSNGEDAAPDAPDNSGEEDKTAEKDKLFAVLEDIEANAQPGSAGASLKIAPYAIEMLNWAGKTALTEEEIKATAAEWLMDKGNDEQVQFSEKLLLADGAVQTLLGENAAGLLEDAGITDAEYPTDAAAAANVDAVMEAVGLR